MRRYRFLFIFCVCFVAGDDEKLLCRTPKNELGICIAVSSCPVLLKPLASLRPSTIRHLQQSICGESEWNFLVCCELYELQRMNRDVMDADHAEVGVKFENTNLKINITHLEDETKLTLTFRKNAKGDNILNLRIKSNSGDLEKSVEMENNKEVLNIVHIDAVGSSEHASRLSTTTKRNKYEFITPITKEKFQTTTESRKKVFVDINPPHYFVKPPATLEFVNSEDEEKLNSSVLQEASSLALLDTVHNESSSLIKFNLITTLSQPSIEVKSEIIELTTTTTKPNDFTALSEEISEIQVMELYGSSLETSSEEKELISSGVEKISLILDEDDEEGSADTVSIATQVDIFKDTPELNEEDVSTTVVKYPNIKNKGHGEKAIMSDLERFHFIFDKQESSNGEVQDSLKDEKISNSGNLDHETTAKEALIAIKDCPKLFLSLLVHKPDQQSNEFEDVDNATLTESEATTVLESTTKSKTTTTKAISTEINSNASNTEIDESTTMSSINKIISSETQTIILNDPGKQVNTEINLSTTETDDLFNSTFDPQEITSSNFEIIIDETLNTTETNLPITEIYEIEEITVTNDKDMQIETIIKSNDDADLVVTEIIEDGAVTETDLVSGIVVNPTTTTTTTETVRGTTDSFDDFSHLLSEEQPQAAITMKDSEEVIPTTQKRTELPITEILDTYSFTETQTMETVNDLIVIIPTEENCDEKITGNVNDLVVISLEQNMSLNDSTIIEESVAIELLPIITGEQSDNSLETIDDDNETVPTFYRHNLKRRFVVEKLLPKKEDCGSKMTDLDDYPWMVYLMFDDGSEIDLEYSLICAGVLISKRYVLTNAFCPRSATTVHVGLYETSGSTTCGEGAETEVAPVRIEDVIYRVFDEYTRHDFALIRLAENLTFSDCVAPICLPLTYNTQKPIDQNSLVFSGWKGQPGRIKKSLTHRIVENQKCYNTGSYTEANFTRDSLVCMKTENSDEYGTFYDEGGPLMYTHDNKWFSYGIITTVFFHADEQNSTYAELDGIKITQEVTEWILDNMRP